METTVYYFVGIKGTGMSALALILHDLGYEVQGSDIAKTTFTQKGLQQAGIRINDFNADNIQEGMTIILGNAFGEDNPEVQRAQELNLPILSYPQMVSQLIEQSTSI